MSMRLIYGRAGTGKSEYILNEIKEKVEKNLAEKIYIIVPEQFSYATEKKLLKTLDQNASINAEVISFKRLAYRVFIDVGGITKTNLSKAGKAMLIEYILDKNKNNLNFLGKTNDLDLIERTITELKKHNVTVEKLDEQIDCLEDEYLRLKLKDINSIYTEYEKIITNNYIDEDDLLTILASRISKSSLFNNSLVYIDEFSGFTEQEYIIIEEILKKANQVNITICTDSLEKDSLPESDVFYSNKSVVEKLIKHCKNTKSKIEKPVKLNLTYRFKNDELKFLEENLYNTKPKTYSKSVEHIHLNLANNTYSELENVANTIIKLVREKDIRYKDISILVKNVDEYIGIANAIFSKYDIPIFIDNKKELSDNILAKYILSMLEIFSKNFSEDSMWSYIKTEFVDIKKEDMYKLENYCKKWGIRGNKWYKEDWKYDQLTVDLELLNDLRKRIINPLLELKESFNKNKTASGMTKCLYMFLEENRIREKLLEKIDDIDELEYENEYITSWNILMNIFDEINLVFNDYKLSFEEYRKILKAGLEGSSIGEIPNLLDQVIIGDVDRSRNHRVDTLFILGLNDGIFPSTNFEEGFLNDNDREQLKQNGMELAKGTLENLFEDRFNIYKAFTTAENDVYLSYVSADKEGKAKRPSSLIIKIKKMFPLIKEESQVIRSKGKEDITVPNATFGELLKNIRCLKNGQEIDEKWKSVYNWYIKKEEWKEKIENAIKGYEGIKKVEKVSRKQY